MYGFENWSGDEYGTLGPEGFIQAELPFAGMMLSVTYDYASQDDFKVSIATYEPDLLMMDAKGKTLFEAVKEAQKSLDGGLWKRWGDWMGEHGDGYRI